MEITFGEHWIAHFGPLQVHMDTIITAWLGMAIVIILSFLATRHLTRVPNLFQSFAEIVVDFVENLTVGQVGPEGRGHVVLVGSLFLFVLASNLIGQLPWKLYHLKQGEFASPTNDINVTAALAVIVLIYYIGAGIYKKGLIGYLKHYFQPIWFMAPINLLEDVTRPFSLALRLFANILAGEIIIMVLIALLPIGLPIPVMLFELFVAFIQAFIFAILSASYIGAATSDSH
ncbi:MAG: F0F1 ATP synthase subunit A [bacterium]